MNGQYLSALPLEAVLPEAKIFFIKSGLVDEAWLEANKDYFARLVDVVRVRVKTLQEVVEAAEYFFKELESYDEKGVGKHFKPEAAELLTVCINALEALETLILPVRKPLIIRLPKSRDYHWEKLCIRHAWL